MFLFWLNEELIEVGCDEVGCGCLVGVVYVVVVILLKDFENELLNDFK